MLKEFDFAYFNLINQAHTGWVDSFMFIISGKFTAIQLYLVILVLLIKRYKSKIWGVLLSIAVLITLSDQISVAFKNGIKRYRPCHTEELKQNIHLVNNHCGGEFGFYSSHASNTMALAIFTSILLPITSLKVFLMFWTAMVGYSRVYLAAHFPLDVLSGWLAGFALALIVYEVMIKRIFKYKIAGI